MRIALIGFTSELFLPFAHSLEEGGFSCYWVHSLRSFSNVLRNDGVDDSKILDLSDATQWRARDEEAIAELAKLERAGLPRINNIILMDRLLRTKPYDFALRYLAYAAKAMRSYIRTHDIEYMASGRDTALQLLSMLVARAAGVTWACTTYMRLPKERFMFTPTHESLEIIPLGKITDDSEKAARTFLEEFRTGALRPYVRPSSPSWKGVVERLPIHLKQAFSLMLKARLDAGNDFARYTLASLARMYVRKKLNLLQLQTVVHLHSGPSDRPYFFFGLHRQPESSIDVLGAFYSDQRNFVESVARSMPLGYELLVKLHISDADGWPAAYLRQLAAIPAVRLISPLADARNLLSGAALTITNSGTMAYEAGLLGRPAITFSKVHFNVLPSVKYCDSITRLAELIDDALARRSTPEDDERITACLTAFFAHSFPGLPNRSVLHNTLTEQDLASLRSAYHALHKYRQQCPKA